MKDPSLLSIQSAAPLIASGRLSATELVEACLIRIAANDPRLNAFITVLHEEASDEARRADEALAHGGHRGPLHGIPISVKDLVDVGGAPTTAASRLRAGHRANADAPVIARLREAGAIVIGKTNLHEFAFGTTSEDSAYGPVRNPYDPDRSPGGSSGGSAASIAAGMALASVGTDTGGSIRIPAAACGVVGLKPGYGEVPCEGVVPLSWSLDHVGPLARTVGDARLLYSVMSGRAAQAGRTREMKTLRLGLPQGYLMEVLSAPIREVFDESIARLRRAGATVEPVALPHAADTPSIYLHVQLPEASAYHARWLEARPGDYTPPVRLRLELGRFVLAEDYVRALRGRDVLTHEVDAALGGVDALVMPTVPIEPPRIGATTLSIDGSEHPVRALMLRLTQIFDLTRHPAISIPCPLTRNQLPCGLQLAGRLGATEELLDIAAACEAQILPGAAPKP